MNETIKPRLKVFLMTNVSNFIKSSEDRLNLHATMLKSESVNTFICKLTALFDKLKEEFKPAEPKTRKRKVNQEKEGENVENEEQLSKLRTNKAMASLTVSYFQEAINLKKEVELTQFDHVDAFKVLNTITSNTFIFCKILSKSPEKLQNLDDIENTQLKKSQYEVPIPEHLHENWGNEPDTGLYLLGGGAMGEIYRRTLCHKNKKRNLKQQLADNALNKCTALLRMTASEKEKDLPIELKNRDNGNMCYPKTSFLPFIKSLNKIVASFANKHSLIKYGTKMIKVCAEESFAFLKSEQQRKLFYQALPENFIDKEVLEHFYREWSRKMVHARIQEFVSSNRKNRKGGQTLRDQLFALKERGKQERKPKIKQARKTKEKQGKTVACESQSKLQMLQSTKKKRTSNNGAKQNDSIKTINTVCFPLIKEERKPRKAAKEKSDGKLSQTKSTKISTRRKPKTDVISQKCDTKNSLKSPQGCKTRARTKKSKEIHDLLHQNISTSSQFLGSEVDRSSQGSECCVLGESPKKSSIKPPKRARIYYSKTSEM